MKQKIFKSHIAATGIPDFAGAVARHAIFTKEWRTHDAMVKADAKNPNIAPKDKHAPYPRPRAHDLIESAVDENDEVNFEIVNDDPTPEKVLALKKSKLSMQLGQAAQAAIDNIVSPARRQLKFERACQILQDDNARAANIQSQRSALFEKLKAAFRSPSILPLEEAMQERSKDDAAFMTQWATQKDQIAKIQQATLQAQVEIEDLTAANIDAWKLPQL